MYYSCERRQCVLHSTFGTKSIRIITVLRSIKGADVFFRWNDWLKIMCNAKNANIDPIIRSTSEYILHSCEATKSFVSPNRYQVIEAPIQQNVFELSMVRHCIVHSLCTYHKFPGAGMSAHKNITQQHYNVKQTNIHYTYAYAGQTVTPTHTCTTSDMLYASVHTDSHRHTHKHIPVYSQHGVPFHSSVRQCAYVFFCRLLANARALFAILRRKVLNFFFFILAWTEGVR